MPTREEIRRVKKAVEADLLNRPGVTGVDVNYKQVKGKKTGDLAIVVYVEKKGTFEEQDRIPATIQGIPTDVVERRFAAFS